MMRHRRISRAKWRDCVTSTGKHWIEQVRVISRSNIVVDRVPPLSKSPDDMPPEKFLQSMIGYHLAYDNSLCGMVMTQGRQRQVINIGLGIKQIAVEPRGATVAAYAESHAHKVSSDIHIISDWSLIWQSCAVDASGIIVYFKRPTGRSHPTSAVYSPSAQTGLH